MSEQPQINVNVNQTSSDSSGGFLGISGILGSLSKILIPVAIILGLILLYVIVMALRPILEAIGQLVGVVINFGEATSIGGLNVPLFILSPIAGLISFAIGRN